MSRGVRTLTTMNGDHADREVPLLPHFLLLALAGAFTGVVSQLSTWHSVTGIDPSYVPFILLVAAGMIIGAIAPVASASLAGLVTGIFVAAGGLIYHAIAHPSARDAWPTVVSYIVIMACLGAFGGFLGAIPVRLLRAFLRRGSGR